MSAWLVVPLLLLLLLSLLWRRPTKAVRCEAPGPMSLPLVGSYFSVRLPLWRWVEARGRCLYGDVIKIVFPDHVAVVVSGYEELREVFMNESLLGRPVPAWRPADRNSGLALSEGKLWRTHRTFTIRALQDFGWGRPGGQADIGAQAALLVARIAQRLSAGEAELRPDGLVQASVCAVIAKMIFGCDAVASDERFFTKLPLIQSQALDGRRSLLQMLLTRLLRRWPRLLRRALGPSVQEPLLDVLHVCQGRIDQRRRLMRQADDADKDYADYIEFYLREKANYFSEDEDNELEASDAAPAADCPLRDGRLAMTIFDLMTGGIDAVANLVSWSLLLAAAYPTAQLRLRSEAAAAFREVGDVNFAEKHRTPYAEAFLEEVQRLVTLLPLGAIRRALRDTTIGGYRIPKGTRVVPNLYGVHHDPKYFPEPQEFKPERFINDSGQFQTSRHLLSFSLGKRACPGESLARMEAFVLVVSVLLSFSVSLPEAERRRLPQLMRGSDGFVRRPVAHRLVFEWLPKRCSADS